MADIGTLLIDGAGTTQVWLTNDYTDIDEGITGADGAYIAALNRVQGTYDSMYTFGNTPADTSNVDTLFYNIRWRTNSTRSDDLNELSLRIVNGATVLAATDGAGNFQVAVTNGSSTSFANTGAVEFSYVNTGASKSTWDGAEVEIRADYTKTSGWDDAEFWVDTLEFTGTYTAAAAATDRTQFFMA